ncbi:MAG: hypothetical protein HC772_11995 [Leptolyngbyaceae cyanobacterium CRU_2_3]|nr:hypothetical protein [Leptolyngbyaceae cyanobacterium CRU_2_3]
MTLLTSRTLIFPVFSGFNSLDFSPNRLQPYRQEACAIQWSGTGGLAFFNLRSAMAEL